MLYFTLRKLLQICAAMQCLICLTFYDEQSSFHLLSLPKEICCFSVEVPIYLYVNEIGGKIIHSNVDLKITDINVCSSIQK